MSQSVEGIVRHYTGWIPVVSGNMSFTEIGKTHACKSYRVVNEMVPSTRQEAILVFGRKSANDGWLHPSLRRWIERRETRFYFLLELRSQSEAGRPRKILQGYVALSPSDSALRSFADSAPLRFSNTDELLVPRQLLENPTVFAARVRIERTGRCDLWLPASYPSDTLRQIAEQFFVFVKDAAHHHYHHDQEADSITYAHPNEGDELGWRAETLYSLHRAIVSARRYKSSRNLRQSLGISAYAEAFETAFLNKDELKPFGERFHNYVYTPIRASIQALQDGAKSQIDRRVAGTVFLCSVTVATSAVLFAAARNFAGPDAPQWPEYVQDSMRYAIAHPIAVLLALFFVFQVILRFAGAEEPFMALWVRWARKLYSRIAFLPKWAVVLLLLSISTLAGLGAWRVFGWLHAAGFV